MSQLDREQTKKSKAQLTTELAGVVANADRLSTGVVVTKNYNAETVEDVVNYTGSGILTGMTVRVLTATGAVVMLDIIIDGVSIASGDTLSFDGTAATYTASIPMNIKFSTSLQVTHSITPNSDGLMTIVTYTHS